jgi:hypothetical protein
MFTKKEQRANLEKLGRYLANLSPAHNKKHFDMTQYFSHDDDAFSCAKQGREALEIAQHHFCGTIACAIGHAPKAMPDEFARLVKEYPAVSSIYHQQAWELTSEHLVGVPAAGALWRFLFGPDWGEAEAYYLSTSWAAADRIAYYLEYKSPPYNWYQSDVFVGCALKAGWITDAKHKANLRNAERVFAAWAPK